MKLLKQICLLLVSFFGIQSQAFDRSNPHRGVKSNLLRIPFLGHKITFSNEPAPKIKETNFNNKNDEGNIVFTTEKVLEETTDISKNLKHTKTESNILAVINPENMTASDSENLDLAKEIKAKSKGFPKTIFPKNDTAIPQILKISSNDTVKNKNNTTIPAERPGNKTEKPNLNNRFGIEEADYLLVPVGTIQEPSIVNAPVTSNSDYRIVNPVSGSQASNGNQASLDNTSIKFPDDNPQVFTPINQIPANQVTGSANQNIIFPLASSNLNNNVQFSTSPLNGQSNAIPVISNPGFNNNVQNLSPQFGNLGNQMQTVVPLNQNNLIPVNGINFNNQANVQVPNNIAYNGNSASYTNYANTVVPQNQVFTQANVLPVGSVQNNAVPINTHQQYYALVNVPYNNNMNTVQNNGQLSNVYLVNPNQIGTGQQLITQPGYNIVSSSNNPYYVASNVQSNQIPINNNNLDSVVFPQNRNYVIVPQNQMASNMPFGNNQQVLYTINN